jgi:hypothetical protein
MGWVSKLISLGFLGFVGFGAYDLYRYGYFDLPDLPEGAYTLSFKNGFRGIVLDADVPVGAFATGPKIFRRLSSADPDRRYIGIPLDVASWFKNTWSTCSKPTDEEKEQISTMMTEMPEWKDIRQDLTGARFDAVCFIEVDGKERIARGFVYSVPKQ